MFVSLFQTFGYCRDTFLRPGRRRLRWRRADGNGKWPPISNIQKLISFMNFLFSFVVFPQIFWIQLCLLHCFYDILEEHLIARITMCDIAFEPNGNLNRSLDFLRTYKYEQQTRAILECYDREFDLQFKNFFILF